MLNPLISIIIVNFNGEKWIKQCLDSLQKQSYSTFEIIFIDNASTDKSVKIVQNNYPYVHLILSKSNLGFAGGNNLGYKYAKGEYILLLNTDTWVEADFLSRFIMAFDQIPNLGSVQSKLVLMNSPSKLDVVGSYWTSSTFLYHFGGEKDATLALYNKAMPFFSNKGASMLLKKSILDELGFFDEDFWCYYEETDLCHRLWVAGYETWYYPYPVAHHAMGATSLMFDNSFIQFHNYKNKLLSFIKNFELSTLVIILPIYLSVSFALSIYWLLAKKWRHSFAIYKSIAWNIKHFPSTLKKRHHIQSIRKVSDKDIFKIVKKNPRLTYYIHLLSGTLRLYED